MGTCSSFEESETHVVVSTSGSLWSLFCNGPLKFSLSGHRKKEQVFTHSLEDWILAGASLPASLLPTTLRRVAYGNAFSTSKPVLTLSKV